jgi:cytochrome c-type biogenesis protein CcmH/NrfG
MGFGWLLLFGGAAMGALVRLGLPRVAWSFAGAALMLGATGYALQGRPFQPGHPAAGAATGREDDPALTDLRDKMLGRYTLDAAYLVAADAMARGGDRRAAVQVLLGGIRKLPRSLVLWTALGTAYAEHDRQVSPPARFAFEQAARLAPTHPAPPFFLGLAMVRAGDPAAARPLWARAMALSPAGVSYRRDIAVRLALLDRYLAMSGGQPPTP